MTLELILRKTRNKTSGTVIGAFETTFGIGWASGPLIAGAISEYFGSDVPYMAFFAAGVAVAAFSIVKRKHLEPAQTR